MVNLLEDIKDRFKGKSLDFLISNEFLREKALIPFLDKKIHDRINKRDNKKNQYCKRFF